MAEGTKQLMSDQEIITVMELPKSAGLVPKYKRIWYIATGSKWQGCLCGNNFNRLFKLCKNYANGIKDKQ